MDTMIFPDTYPAIATSPLHQSIAVLREEKRRIIRYVDSLPRTARIGLSGTPQNTIEDIDETVELLLCIIEDLENPE